MAEAAPEPTEEVVEGEPKKKKPILLILVIVLSVIVLIMSVMFGTLYFSGFFEHKSEAAAHEKVDELEKEAEAARSELAAVRKAALADIDALRAQLAELGNDVEILHDEKAQMHEKLRHTQAVHASLLADHNQLLVQQRRAEAQIRSLEHELEKMRKDFNATVRDRINARLK
jgi:flagellar basal body-associated protein FliL